MTFVQTFDLGTFDPTPVLDTSVFGVLDKLVLGKLVLVTSLGVVDKLVLGKPVLDKPVLDKPVLGVVDTFVLLETIVLEKKTHWFVQSLHCCLGKEFHSKH